jgi:hypothetical protein
MQHISQALLPQVTAKYQRGIKFIFPDVPISLNETLIDQQDRHNGIDRRAWWLNLDNTSRYIGLQDTIATLGRSLGGRPVQAGGVFPRRRLRRHDCLTFWCVVQSQKERNARGSGATSQFIP